MVHQKKKQKKQLASRYMWIVGEVQMNCTYIVILYIMLQNIDSITKKQVTMTYYCEILYIIGIRTNICDLAMTDTKGLKINFSIQI